MKKTTDEDLWMENIYGPVSIQLKEIDGRFAIVSGKTGRFFCWYKGVGVPTEDWMDNELFRIRHCIESGRGSIRNDWGVFPKDLPDDYPIF